MTGPPPPPPPGGDPRHGAAGHPTLAGAPTPGPGDPAAIDPLSNRLLWIAGLLGVLLVAVLANAALNNNEGGLNPVAQAAERTARMPGVKLAMEVSYSSESSPTVITGSGSGAYDAKTGRTEVQISVPIPGHPTVTVESVGDDRQMLLRSPMFGGELPPGKEWLGMEPLLGNSAESAFGSTQGAGSTIEMLKAVGDGAERLDQETVRGHLTTRYKGSIELSRAVEVLEANGKSTLAKEYRAFAERSPDAMPIEVWVDDHGLARRIRMVEQIPIGDTGKTLSADIKTELFDFGPQPKIELPPKQTVFDYTPVLRAELGLEDGSQLGPFEPAADAPALSTADFHARGAKVCHTVVGKAEALFARNTALFEELHGLSSSDLSSDGAKQIVRAYGSRVLEPAYRLLHAGTRELAALVPPPSLASDYRRYLLLDTIQLEEGQALTRVLALGQTKIPGADKLEAEAEARKAERERLASSLGLSACETDVQLPGGQPETSIE